MDVVLTEQDFWISISLETIESIVSNLRPHRRLANLLFRLVFGCVSLGVFTEALCPVEMLEVELKRIVGLTVWEIWEDFCV